jgi:hypothetical protein
MFDSWAIVHFEQYIVYFEFFFIKEEAKHFWLLSSKAKVTHVLILTEKTGWATFWASFSQTRHVTLISIKATASVGS